MEPIERRIEYFYTVTGRVPYKEWHKALGDVRTQAIIDIRIARLRAVNFGYCAPVGEGVLELKVNFGPGYRLYIAQIGSQVVLLLTGGNKSTQNKDIRNAKAYWHDYKERHA